MELLGRINRKLFKRLAYIYQREGLSETDLSVQWRMNHRQSPCRVSELAEETGIPPSTLTGILDRLVARGLLERLPDPDDRRGILMKSTPEGFALLQRMTIEVNEEMNAILSILPEGRLQGLIADMQLILDFLEHDKQ